MQVKAQKCRETFRKVQLILEHIRAYRLAPGRVKASIEDLHWAIQDMYDLRIAMWHVSFASKHLRGLVERYADKSARIFVLSEQPDDWKRFTAAKELVHLAVDEPEDWSPKGAETIDSLLYEVHLETGVLPRGNVQSELLAWYAAIELLYPFEWRHADAEAVKAGTTTARKLALEYALPEAIIERALRPDHMALCRAIWEDVNAYVNGLQDNAMQEEPAPRKSRTAKRK